MASLFAIRRALATAFGRIDGLRPPGDSTYVRSAQTGSHQADPPGGGLRCG